jgi:1-acyl-sn-glycerol-3-phosphate acyltransferase
MQPLPRATTQPATGPTARRIARAAKIGAFTLETWSRLSLAADCTPAETARELSWVAENLCALHGVRIALRGELAREPSVIVANHISYFDPLVISSLMPCAAIAKREVAGWPVIGELLKRMGVMWIARGDAASGARVLFEAQRALEQGVSVLVFPEGTTTDGQGVLPMKRGSFGLAKLAGVPVVPVALSYERREAAWTGDDAFLPHYLRSMGEACTRVSVRVLDPVSMTGRQPEPAAAQVREAIERALSQPFVRSLATRRATAAA